MRAFAWLPLFAALLFTSAASADVVGPPPDNCPDGTKGQSCHGGPFCAPMKCDTDADCSVPGQSCKDVAFCTEDSNCSGGWGAPDAAPVLIPNALGLCDNGACTTGTCNVFKVCTGGPGTSSASSASASSGSGSGGGSSSGSNDGDQTIDRGCGCIAAGDRAAPFLGAAVFAIGAGIALSRRRKR